MKKNRFSYKILFILSVIVLCAFLLPLLTAGMYAVPCADDFSYGYEAHKVFTETGSVFKALWRGLEHVGEVYTIWQGTYSAIFLFSVQPAVFGEGLYSLTAFIMLFSVTAGCLFFAYELFTGVFGVNKYISGVIGCVVTVLCTQLLPSPVQGFYWYNGAVFYTFFYGLSLIAFALGIKSVINDKKSTTVWLCILCAILGGGNYVTALTCAIVGVSSAALLMIVKDRRRKKLLVPLGILLLGFAVSAAAPGNFIRQSTVENSPGALEAIFLSFEECAEYSLRWFSLPLLGALVLLAPFLWQSAKVSSFRFRYPLLISAYSYCLLSAMFCPPIFALGNVGEFRLLNIIFFAFVLLVVINIFYWLGWAAQKLGKSSSAKSGAAFLPLLGCILISAALTALFILGGGSLCSVSALGILRSGEAKAFHDCAEGRLRVLADPSVSDAKLDEYPAHPYLLYYDDITEDPSDWKNIDMASYYGKNSVVLTGCAQTPAAPQKDALSAYRKILESAPALEGAHEELADASFGYEQNLEKFGTHYDLFALSDLDRNGVPELIVRSVVNFRWTPVSVYTYADGNAVLLKDPLDAQSSVTFEQNSSANGAYTLYICEENHIHSVWRGDTPIGEMEEDHAYALEGTSLVLKDCPVGENENTVYFSDTAKENSAENRDALTH